MRDVWWMLSQGTDPFALTRYAVSRSIGRISRTFRSHKIVERRTYSRDDAITSAMARHFPPVPLELLSPLASMVLGVAGHYCSGRFDVLGSGWTAVRHGMRCRGVEGHAYPSVLAPAFDRDGLWLENRVSVPNLPEARRIWRLISAEHSPIDWQLDFKSGWRYDECLPAQSIVLDPVPGADVKVPWELARMHHVIFLAYAYRLLEGNSLRAHERECMRNAFRDQILDFVATNPPGFGVNWRGTMDVAIRIANWVVGYDLFRAFGASFDTAFEKVLARSVLEHGLHIRKHLDWHPVVKANHYIAGLAGLIFVAAYLPVSIRTKRWLRFAWRRLLEETAGQFLEDGGNFESSTCYHRLVCEMVVYSTAIMESARRTRPALVGGLGTPVEHLERVAQMGNFMEGISLADGTFPQIGDNDSGRFLKMAVVFDAMTVAGAKQLYANLDKYADIPEDGIFWDERAPNCSALLAAIHAISNPGVGAPGVPEALIEHHIVSGLAGERTKGGSAGQPARGDTEDSDEVWRKLEQRLGAIPESQRLIHRFPVAPEVCGDNILRFAYSAFGLYVIKSEGFYMAIRCGRVGQRGWGAHAHNDQLSLSLRIGGRWIWRDPGTYLYTPVPEQRNLYRSAKVHFCPRIEGMEPGDLGRGLFRLADRAHAQCLYFGERGFVGVHFGYVHPVIRRVYCAKGFVGVEDFLEAPATDAKACGFTSEPSRVAYSPKYGYRHW
jgi:Heparinase II/III N-terminus/Heparinase II/III-like protein